MSRYRRAVPTAACACRLTLISEFENSGGGYWGRPVDAVPGPDGALYVSDDSAGAIYRLMPAR
jgi:glucose/arabinose dehydrogenase